MGKITLLLTLYKPTIEEIEYWTNFYLEVKNDIDFHWLVDNPQIEIDDRVESKDIFVNETNIGKLSTVYNHIKNGLVRTPYFKAVDPDDFISIEMLKSFEIPENDYSIITFNSTKEIGIKALTQEDVEEKMKVLSGKLTLIPSYGTSYTILPTRMLLIDNFFSKKRIDADDDQVLGYLCYANGGEIIKSTSSFYLYAKFVGQTSPQYFENLVLNLIPAYEEYENIHKLSSKKFGYNFRSIQNHIFNMKVEFEKKFGKITKDAEDAFNFIMIERNL